MKNPGPFIVFIFITFFLSACKTEAPQKPTGVNFHNETLKRLGGRGDNWCITWAGDDSQITSLCDGNWLNNPQGGYRNHLYRILGGPNDFSREDIPDYPKFSDTVSWFGYGVVTVDGVIYSAISKTPGNSWTSPFLGVKLLKSPDNGKSWYRLGRDGSELKLNGPLDSMRGVVNKKEMFFLQEYQSPHNKQLSSPFLYFDFVHCGRDNSAAKDDYLYMYAPDGAFSFNLNLARVHKNRLGHRNEWEYFKKYDENGHPQWTPNMEERGTVYQYPEKSEEGHYFGWYSWLPSVVWNEGLGLYIMVNGGTYGGHGMTNADSDYYSDWMHEESGSLGFWYSENPYGPWKQFYYAEHWIVDENNLNYQPKLSPKWISKDGKTMTLIWSDAKENEQGESHSVNYLWNQMEIAIVLK